MTYAGPSVMGVRMLKMTAADVDPEEDAYGTLRMSNPLEKVDTYVEHDHTVSLGTTRQFNGL